MSRDQTIKTAKANIKKYGFTVTGVTTSPPFTYTSGFVAKDMPDLLVSGLEIKTAHGVLSSIYQLANNGLKLESGMVMDDILGDGYKIMLIDIDSDKTEMHLTQRLYGEGFPAMAVILPDKDHRWPWEEGVSTQYLSGQEHVMSLIGSKGRH